MKWFHRFPWWSLMSYEMKCNKVFVLCDCIFCPSQYFVLFLELHRQNLRLDLQILLSDFGPRYSANASCTTWPGCLNLSFTVSTYFNDINMSRFHLQKSFCKVLSVYLLFFENVNLNLTLALCCERYSKSLYWLWNASALSSSSWDFPRKWTVFFLNQLKIIKSISSASLTSMTFIFGDGSVIMNLCTSARESWKTRVWEKLNKIDAWINCVRSSECRTWHFRESRIFKYFSEGKCPWTPYNSCIRDWQSARFSSNNSA